MMSKNEVTPEHDWHRIDIVAALHKEGPTMRALSVEAGLKPDTLKNTLSRAYPKGERIIAKALGTEPTHIWPSRYIRKAS